MRGLASIAVVFHHFLLAFYFPLHGYGRGTLDESPISFLFNGEAAVFLFFVLSGYVLPRKYYRTGHTRELAVSIIKRIPRLAGPVLISVLVGMALWQVGAFACQDAGALSKSAWLSACTNSDILSGRMNASWFDAVWQGTFGTFLTGENGYNSNLWTMQPEFFGSLLAYTLALGLIRPTRWFIAVPVFIFLVLLSLQINSSFPIYLTCFVVGALLSALHCVKPVVLPSKLIPLFIVFPLLCFSSLATLGQYLPGVNPTLFKYLTYEIGAGLLIWGTVTIPALNNALSGKIGYLLGKISFPLYLAHTLLIASLCSWGVLVLTPLTGYGAATLLAFIGLIITLIPLLYFYVRFDDWWLKVIGRLSRSLHHRPTSIPLLGTLLVVAVITLLMPFTPPRYVFIETPNSALQNRTPVTCPDHGYFMIALGQSNAANSIEGRQSSNAALPAYNLYNGLCYAIQDPVLGATHQHGSFWTPFSQQLSAATGQPVLFITAASGNSAVGEWTDPRYPYIGRFEQQIETAPESARQLQPIIFWHQGEADNALGTPSELYEAQLDHLLTTLRQRFAQAGYVYPPLFRIFQVSLCAEAKANPALTAAQARIAEKRDDTELVMNTDELGAAFRTDGCHFNAAARDRIVETLMNKTYPLAPIK